MRRRGGQPYRDTCRDCCNVDQRWTSPIAHPAETAALRHGIGTTNAPPPREPVPPSFVVLGTRALDRAHRVPTSAIASRTSPAAFVHLRRCRALRACAGRRSTHDCLGRELAHHGVADAIGKHRLTSLMSARQSCADAHAQPWRSLASLSTPTSRTPRPPQAAPSWPCAQSLGDHGMISFALFDALCVPWLAQLCARRDGRR